MTEGREPALLRDREGVGVGVADIVGVGVGVVVEVGEGWTDGDDAGGVGDAGDTAACAGTTMLPTIGFVHVAGKRVTPAAAATTA